MPEDPSAEDMAVIGREPPHSAELELTVLAVLLDGRHATAIHTIRQYAEHPLVFYRRDHRLVYQACLDIDDAGERVDAQAVAEHLKRTHFRVGLERLRKQELLQADNQLDGMGRSQLRALYRERPEDLAQAIEDSALATIGGYAGLGAIGRHYVSAAGLERNAKLLQDYALKRRLINQLTSLADRTYRTTEPFDTLADLGGQGLLELTRTRQSGQVFDMISVVDETLETIQARADSPNEGVKTGYVDLDDMLMALRPGGLYVLAARPGVGKTSFALSLVENLSTMVEDDDAERQGVLLFSLEVDRVDLVKKLLCSAASIDFRKLERGMIEDAEWEALTRAAQDFKQWPLDLMDVSDLTVQALRAVVKRHQLEHGNKLKLVVIDYLQLLSSARNDTNEYEKVSEISRTLKILARELRLPVLALSQMSRQSEQAAGKPREPRLSDLRGSGSIEQDADAVMFLHRVNSDEDEPDVQAGREVKVVVAKNRFGPTGAVPMRFFPARQRFVVTPKNELAPGGAPGEVSAPVSGNGRFDTAPTNDEDLFG